MEQKKIAMENDITIDKLGEHTRIQVTQSDGVQIEIMCFTTEKGILVTSNSFNSNLNIATFAGNSVKITATKL